MKFIKNITMFLLLAAVGSIIYGYSNSSENSEKFIGFGVIGLFFLVFPLFCYYRWKGKNINDYMLTKENLDKMRNTEKKRKV